MSRRKLAFYDPAAPGTLSAALRESVEQGASSALVPGAAPPSWMEQRAREAGLRTLRPGGTLPAGAFESCDLVVIPPGDTDTVAGSLHALLGEDIAVLAPVTDGHFSRRVVYLLSIPKAGTHMMLRLFEIMGLPRSPERHPQPGSWCTVVGYQYHPPCRELFAGDWFEPVGRQLFLRSPGVFVYRHPLDIVVSELDWFLKSEHAFSGFLRGFHNDDDRIEALIADGSVMGTIRERVMRHAGWIHFSNVCPVSYEELVGSRGQGSDSEQADTIWALQLKLQIPGDPAAFAARLYDPGSATFSKGRIGRHIERFSPRHFEAVSRLPSDFLDLLGYVPGRTHSSRSTVLRERPLHVKQLQFDQLYTPRLVREGLAGDNIVEIAGRYFAVRQGRSLLSSSDAFEMARTEEGFAAIGDAIEAAPRHRSDAPAGATPRSVDETFFGFRVVRLVTDWAAVRLSAGDVDLNAADTGEVARLEAEGLVVRAGSEPRLLAAVLERVVEAIWELPGSPAKHPVAGGNGITSIATRLARIAREIDDFRAGMARWHPEPSAANPLVMEGFLGFNLVCVDTRWLAVDQSLGPTDLREMRADTRNSLERQALIVSGSRPGLVLGRVLIRALSRIVATCSRELDGASPRDHRRDDVSRALAEVKARWRDLEADLEPARASPPAADDAGESDYFGFDIVHVAGRWFGVPSAGRDAADPSQSPDAFARMVRTGVAVAGPTVDAVRVAVLGIVIGRMREREQIVEDTLAGVIREIRGHRDGGIK